MDFLDSLINTTKASFKDSNMKTTIVGKKVVMSPVLGAALHELNNGIPCDAPMIDIVIENIDILEQTFNQYVLVAKRQPELLLKDFWQNATNSDFANPADYLKRYIAFYHDTTFNRFYNEQVLMGTFGEDNLYCDVYEFTTHSQYPYAMRLSLQPTNQDLPLPFLLLQQAEKGCALPCVLYGITGNTCYIYGTKTFGRPIKNTYAERVDKAIKSINRGNNAFRNVSPSTVFTLSIFCGLLQKEGINKIKCADFAPLKWLLQNGTSEEKMARETDKFLMSVARLSHHFKNIKITDFPNDIDSFMHISIDGEVDCDRQLLKDAYLFGRGDILSLISYQ